MIILHGINPFYEGWLCGALGFKYSLESPSTLDPAYISGFRTAVETGRQAVQVLLLEIELGHIIAERKS